MSDQRKTGSAPVWKGVFKGPFEWIDTGLDWFERSALIACVVAMAVVTVANVLARNLMGFSLQFANDAAQILLVMVTFLGIGIGARHARHIRVSALHDLLPPLGQKILLIIVSFTTAGLLFLFAEYAWNYADAAQRSCRVLPDAVNLGLFKLPLGGMPLAAGIVITLVALALAGHGIRLVEALYTRMVQPLPGWQRSLTLGVSILVGLSLAYWVFGLFIDLVEARSGQCRVTSSTGFPVYLYYMVVPLGFMLGGIQFFLAGVRNLISRENYLSWYQKDEYEEEGVDPGMATSSGLSDEELAVAEEDIDKGEGGDNRG